MSKSVNPIINQPFMNHTEKFDRCNYYYVRDDTHNPIGVVFLGERDGVVSKGVSICSKDEKVFDRTAGVKLAVRRALRADKKRANSEPINTVNFTESISEFLHFHDGEIRDKSSYDVNLSDFEKSVIRKPLGPSVTETK